MSNGIIIIGAGHAGIQTAASLRERGYEGRIRLVAEESDAPYQKPPLSKDYLKGKVEAANLAFRAENFYSDRQIDLHLGQRVEHLDPAERTVTLSDGQALAYDQLVLATGARNRPLPVPGADLAGVCYLRTLADAQQIRAQLEQAQRVAVIGGGFIGLELAAVAAEKGKAVAVIEAQERLMARVLPPLMSEVFAQTHREHGVALHLGQQVAELLGENGRVCGLRTQQGLALEADLVLVGIGVLPNQELAEAAGLACRNGIAVDEQLRSADPHIFAIGDCACYPHWLAGRELRLESVQNATDQAKALAATLTGTPTAYQSVPWFWTHQYHLKLQMAGINQPHDRYLLRGKPDSGKFSVFYFQKDRLIGADSLNSAADHLVTRRLLAEGMTPADEQLSDTGFKLKKLF